MLRESSEQIIANSLFPDYFLSFTFQKAKTKKKIRTTRKRCFCSLFCFFSGSCYCFCCFSGFYEFFFCFTRLFFFSTIQLPEDLFGDQQTTSLSKGQERKLDDMGGPHSAIVSSRERMSEYDRRIRWSHLLKEGSSHRSIVVKLLLR